MAEGDRDRTPEQVRRDIAGERERLAQAVEALRGEVGEATDIRSKLTANLPLVAAGALGAGFFLAGGIGSTMKLIARRSREGHETIKVKAGRWRVLERD